MNGSGSGEFLNFFAKRSQSAFSVIHIGGIWIPGAFWNALGISMLGAMWSDVSVSFWCQCVAVNSYLEIMIRSSVDP